MRVIKYLFLCIILLVACANRGNQRSDALQSGLQLKIKTQFAESADPASKITDHIDYVHIFKLKDLKILESPFFKYTTRVILDENGDVVDEKQSDLDTAYAYFIFKDDTHTGVKLDSLASLKRRRFNVDSLLKCYAYNNVTLDNQTIDIKDHKNNLLTEYYKPIRRIGPGTPDSVILTFDPKQIHNDLFTFSKQLDSLKKAKLINVKYVFNKTDAMPRREIVMSLTPFQIKNKLKIENTVEKAYNDIFK